MGDRENRVKAAVSVIRDKCLLDASQLTANFFNELNDDQIFQFEMYTRDRNNQTPYRVLLFVALRYKAKFDKFVRLTNPIAQDLTDVKRDVEALQNNQTTTNPLPAPPPQAQISPPQAQISPPQQHSNLLYGGIAAVVVVVSAILFLKK